MICFGPFGGGGGNRFGIVISLTLKVFPAKCVSYIEIQYNKHARSLVLALLQNEYQKMPHQISVQMKLSANGCLLNVLSYFPLDLTQRHLQKFLNIPGKISVHTQTPSFYEVMKQLDTLPQTPHFFKLTARFTYQKLDKTHIHYLLNAVDHEKKVVLTFNLLGGKIAYNKTYNSSFNHRNAIFFVQAYVSWESYEYRSHYIKVIETINEIFSQHETGMYINIAESNVEKVSQHYFLTHLHALSAIKMKYRIDGRILN